MKRKHAELIKAFADGADIEWKMPHQTTWDEIAVPTWNEHYEYRIKQKPKYETAKFDLNLRFTVQSDGGVHKIVGVEIRDEE